MYSYNKKSSAEYTAIGRSQAFGPALTKIPCGTHLVLKLAIGEKHMFQLRDFQKAANVRP